MRFVCESCRAQYMINDEKVGPKGVKVRCRKCGYVILVKRSDAPKVTVPVAASNDPDDSTATQVMQAPTGNGIDEPKTEIMSNASVSGLTLDEDPPKKTSGGTDNFLGADDDEIGAVFDQVLKTGSSSETHDDDKPALGLDEDRQNTRVIDAETAKKLASESSDSSGESSEPKPEEVAQTDWYVAVNDKQTGPLTLDQVKAHWEKGEIGPDSLCWRAGYSDWLPLSEVKALASVLAPKPPKPIVVAAAATVSTSLPGAQAVMSVPVQSAFSSGGVMQTVQSEVQVPIAVSAAAVEDTGTWRPNAASALASLVKDEMEAIAKPAVAAQAEPIAEDSPRRLLDLPDDKPSMPGSPAPSAERAPERAARSAEPLPVNPYMANPAATYSAPALTQYRPPSNRGLMIGLIVGGVLLVALFILVLFVALREPKYVPPPVVTAGAPPTTNPAPAPTPTPAAPSPSAAAGTPAPVAAAVPPAPVAGAQAVAPAPAPAPPPSGTAPNPGGTAVAAAPAPAPAHPVTPTAATARPSAPSSPRVAKADAPAAVEEKRPSKTEAAPSGGGDSDDFDKAFGSGGSKKKEEKKADDTASAKKKDVYIPPAPGSGGDIKDELGTSDIMEVVSANKPALAKCVEEQRKKDPGASGKLVMRWTVLTNGRTANIGVSTDEFKGTYIASCIGGLVKTWQFPKSKKQGEPVQFPFKF